MRSIGISFEFILTLFLKTKTRKPLTRSLRCYAPWFARLQLANFGYAQDDTQWQEKLLLQVQLSASFVQREVARDSVTEGLFLLKSSATLRLCVIQGRKKLLSQTQLFAEVSRLAVTNGFFLPIYPYVKRTFNFIFIYQDFPQTLRSFQ